MKTIKFFSALIFTLFVTVISFGQFNGGIPTPGNTNLAVKPPQHNANFNVCDQKMSTSAGHLLNYTKRQDEYKEFYAVINVLEFTMTLHSANRNGKNYTAVTSGYLNDNNGGILTSKEDHWNVGGPFQKAKWQELRREEHKWQNNIGATHQKISNQQVELEINGLGCVSVRYSFMGTPKMVEQVKVLDIGGVTYIMGYIFNQGDPTMVTIALRTDKVRYEF